MNRTPQLWRAEIALQRIFYRGLVPELRRRGKTVLEISHDEAYFPSADRVLKMDYGRIITDAAPTEPLLEGVAVGDGARSG